MLVELAWFLKSIPRSSPAAEKGKLMTLMTTIVAVALGLTPVPADGKVQPAGDSALRLIGRYSETTDDTGTTHLQGVDRRTGKAFHLTVNPFGRVEGAVGEKVVTFKVATLS